MLENTYVKEHLKKTVCYKCGNSLESATLQKITEAPMALVTHAICSHCQAESMVTVTTNGTGVVPILSDLSVTEFKKFIGAKSVTNDEVLEIHKLLKKENIWNLLQKKEKYLEKKQAN